MSYPYPEYIFDENIKNALLLCCAEFNGKCEVKYFNKHNINKVTLIDINENKMNEMKNINYKNQTKWEYIIGDCYDNSKKLMDNNIKFDVVNIDSWSGMVEDLFSKHFKLLYNLSNKYIVLIYTHTFDLNNKIKLNKNNLENYIFKKHNIKIKVIDFFKRGNYNGGLYWIVIKKN